MLQGLDLTQIKAYNESLKNYKAQAAKLNAEIEYTNKEIDNLCAELSKELGQQVTRDNLEQIYNEQVDKINTTLQSGIAVLNKINSEEQRLSQGQASTNVQVQQPQTQQPVYNTSPIQTQATGVQQTPVNTQTVQSVFDSGVSMTAQPMFKLGI